MFSRSTLRLSCQFVQPHHPIWTPFFQRLSTRTTTTSRTYAYNSPVKKFYPTLRNNAVLPQTVTQFPPLSLLSHQQQTRRIQILLPPAGGPRYQRFGGSNQPPNRSVFYLYHLWKTSHAFRLTTLGLTIGGGLFYASNIEIVPISGRRRFNIISAETEAQLAKSMYDGVLAEFGSRILPASHPYSRLVKQVMARLVPVSGLEDLNWEVYVIADKAQKNAFVIPGGKVFVFSGILDLCGQGEDGLATVLAHEISHTVAHHAAERMSQMFLVVGALWAATVLLGGNDGGLGRILMDLVFLRPSSRKQEAEADYIGLMMMASACYNPERAIDLWLAMEREGGQGPPQFLSTHPAHRARIEKIKEWLPEAKEKQAASDCAQTMDYASDFRKVFDYHVW